MAQRQRARLITARSQDQSLLSVFIIRSLSELPRCQYSTPFHRRGAAAARAAHNRKDIRSKRIAGIFQFAVSRTASLSLQHPITGVAQRLARGAHNSEVRCSNHLSGIYHSLALQKLVVKLDVKGSKRGVNLRSRLVGDIKRNKSDAT